VQRSKFYAPKLTTGDPDDPCSIPSNKSKALRDFEAGAVPIPNYYLLAAAGTDEHSLDGGRQFGGLATTSFYECTLPGSGADTNGDGVITLEEAKICAQKRLSPLIQPPYTRQTFTEGNGPGGNTPRCF